MSILNFLFVISILNPVLLIPTCKEGTNNCERCHPITKLCEKCTLDIYSPDENGGCLASGKCNLGKNYCSECDQQEQKCLKCESGLFPDENGGCSFVDNCELSSRGLCLKCKSDYLLIGGEQDIFKICKSKSSEDILNCQTVNNATGLCEACEEGYFLNAGDFKCTKIENCLESAFGKCISCSAGFYLNIKENKCFSQFGTLINCKESLNGEKCDVCDDDFFYDENGNCVSINYCADSNYYTCNKCQEGYYLTYDKGACTKEKNCFSGERLYGICKSCIGKNYLDLETRICNSNQEDNDFKNCLKVEDGKCLSCEYGFNLSEDGKCTMTTNCVEVDKGECLVCGTGYFLDLDNRCTTTEHCIHSENYYECNECEDDFYYNKKDKVCLKQTKGFENCKSTSYDGDYCFWCKTGYYGNQTDHLCYSNEEKNAFYKCTLSDTTGKYCIGCENNYFNGYKDHKCSKVDGCDISESEEKCLECDERYCLNVKTGICYTNEKVINEEEKFYYRCNKTNEEGTKCAVCLEGYELSDNGYCVDKIHCTIEEDGVCVKCKNNREYSSCLNSDFGCVPTVYMKCLECNNNLDFDKCTKCPPYYKLDKDDVCIDIDEEE